MKTIVLGLTIIMFFVGNTFAQQLRVILRVDDVLSRNTTYLPRSIQPFEQVASVRGARVTWVTIPHRLIESTNADGSLTRELRTTVQRGHEISQHGYNHICTICSNTGHEMWCATQSRSLTADQQRTLILNGMRILLDSVGVVPRTWVSPGHFEDSVTYSLLGANGFRYLSSTQLPTGHMPASLFNIRPASDYTWALTAQTYSAKLSEALNDARTIGESSGVFVVLFHDPFIRQGYENGIVLRWTAELLDSLQQRYAGRLRFRTFAQAAAELQSTASVSSAQSSVPTGFELMNYPNPFNPKTIINYQLPIGNLQFVSLKVFDVRGREVATLVNEVQDAGFKSVEFNADGLAGGVYFYRLQSLGNSQTRKFVLMK